MIQTQLKMIFDMISELNSKVNNIKWDMIEVKHNQDKIESQLDSNQSSTERELSYLENRENANTEHIINMMKIYSK